MKNLNVLIVIFFISSCASHTLVIEADVPSRIEASGVTVCETTPCRLQNSCVRHGERTSLEAFPINRSSGYNQSKVVSANCSMGSRNETFVFFEMASQPGVAVEKSSLSNTPSQEKKLEEVRLLKKLYDQGDITEKAYNEMVQKILDTE